MAFPPADQRKNTNFSRAKAEQAAAQRSTPGSSLSPHLDFTDTVNFQEDNLTELYNNPALFDDKSLTIPMPVRPQSFWSTSRLCLFLCPAFSIEFCRVFTAMFMFVHIMIRSIANVMPLLIGGTIGLAVTLGTSKLFSDKYKNKLSKRRALLCFLLHQVILLVATSFIVGSSWSNLFFEEDTNFANASTGHEQFVTNNANNEVISREKHSPNAGTSNETYFRWIYRMPNPLLENQILTTFGYIVLSSLTGSGQYLTLCLAWHVAKTESRQLLTDITVVVTAIGACTAGFVGAIDMASNWCPANVCPSHVIAQAAIISSGILCLLVICALCCLAAFYYDVIRLKWRRLWPFDDAPFHNSARRSTRTAQEIFDECAALLHDHETSFSSSHVAGSSIATEDMKYGAITTKQYPHQITASFQEPKLRKMLKNGKFVGAVTSLFLLSITSVIFQFYSTSYLSHVIPITNTTGVKYQRDKTDWSHWEAPLDVRYVFGLKMNGLAVFLTNGLFIIGYLKRSTISSQIRPEWKPRVIPIMLLAVAVLAVVTVATGNVISFLLTACVASFARLVETVLLQTVVPQLTRTWPPVDPKLTNGPTTFLWSLIPVSLMMSSLTVSVIWDCTNFTDVPIYFMAGLAIMACLTFIISRNMVI